MLLSGSPFCYQLSLSAVRLGAGPDAVSICFLFLFFCPSEVMYPLPCTKPVDSVTIFVHVLFAVLWAERL